MMKRPYRSLLVITATIAGVSLYAYLGPDIKDKEAEKQLEAVVASTVQIKDTHTIDPSTGLPLIKHEQNELVFTADIQETIASKLVEQLVMAGFFRNTSSHKMILGREPNSYIIFYTPEHRDLINEDRVILKKMLQPLSAAVFNHQPVVIKVINEEKEVQQVIM